MAKIAPPTRGSRECRIINEEQKCLACCRFRNILLSRWRSLSRCPWWRRGDLQSGTYVSHVFRTSGGILRDRCGADPWGYFAR
jgi:hypothetical protein